MNEFHYPRRPSKVAITTSCILHFFFPHLKLFFDLRDPYDCMVSGFWISTFFSWFLKVIFRSMFFPSNSLVKESNIFSVFKEDTCGTSWSVTESTMLFLALTKFFLWRASSLISLWNWNLHTHVGVQSIFFKGIIYFQAWKLSTSASFSLSWCEISYWNENLKCK